MLAAALSIAIVASVVGGVCYRSTQPSKAERIAACLERLGTSTAIYHDDGREQQQTVPENANPDVKLLFHDHTVTVQVRPPRSIITTWFPNGAVAAVTILDRNGSAIVSYRQHPRSQPRSTPLSPTARTTTGTSETDPCVCDAASGCRHVDADRDERYGRG
jgi:hypothetical protein